MVIANTLTMVHHSRSPTRRWSNRSSETFAGGKMQDDDDDDDIRGLDLEALEQEAVAEATSRSELAALSQESTPELPRKKVQTTLAMAAR
jgi:hypothetical protein